MSEIPADDETIVRELLGWKWSDQFDRENTKQAISRVFDEMGEFKEFIEKHRDRYYDTSEFTTGDYPISWRDYRNMNIGSPLKNGETQFDWLEIVDLCKQKLKEVKQE